MKDRPKRIYLQDFGDIEVSWCSDKISDGDLEYIAIEEYDRLTKELEEAQERNTELVKDYNDLAVLYNAHTSPKEATDGK